MNRIAKRLICIYTCKQDEVALNKLKQTEWYKQVLEDKHCTVYSVFADASIKSEYILDKENNTLIIKAEEDYSKLSLKTHQMMKVCVELEEFDFLIKVDATLINFRNKSLLSFDYFCSQFNNTDFYKEYGGILWYIRQEIWRIEEWAKSKNLKNVDVKKVFDTDDDIAPFYSGKCYVLGYDFCKFVASHGGVWADKFAKYVGGSEDTMMGLIHREYSANKELMERNPPYKIGR